MGDYQSNRKWADQFIDQTRSIIGTLLVEGATFKLDTQESTDLLVVQSIQNGSRGGRPIKAFATRLRRPNVFRGRSPRSGAPWAFQFTIRSRLDSGAVTELAKLKQGFVDWYLYGHVEQFTIRHWMVLDIDVFRAFADSSAIKTETVRNDDGTEGIAYDIRSFPDALCIAMSETMALALDKGVDAVDPLPDVSIKENPLKPPDLMALVHQFDGYDKITPTAWAAYSEQLALYRRAIAKGDGWMRG